MGRMLRGSLCAIGLVVLLAAPVAGGTSNVRSFERARSARAIGEECRDSSDGTLKTCDRVSAYVYKGRRGGTNPNRRFAGHEVCVSRSTYTTDRGSVIRFRTMDFCVKNAPSLHVRFDDGIRRASVQGTIRAFVSSCTYVPTEVCEEREPTIAVHLTWTALPGPATEEFSYKRTTSDGCETTITSTVRSRSARAAGELGGRPVPLLSPSYSPTLEKVDRLRTRVCQ